MLDPNHFPRVGHKCRLAFIPRNRFARQVACRLQEKPLYAERMMALMVAKHLKNPGGRYELYVYEHLNRARLNQETREFFEAQHDGLNHTMLDDEVMLALEPRENKQPQDSSRVLAETFFFPLYEPTNSVLARDILADMGFRSVTTEMAQSHTVQKNWWRLIDGKRVVILDAKYQGARSGGRKFLELSMGVDKSMHVQLHDGNYFDAHICFLVEKITPQPKKDGE